MPRGLAFSAKQVDLGRDGVVEDVSISTRHQVARVRRQSVLVVEKSGVVGVAQLSNVLWRVDFDDGSSWSVERAKRNCGCG